MLAEIVACGSLKDFPNRVSESTYSHHLYYLVSYLPINRNHVNIGAETAADLIRGARTALGKKNGAEAEGT